MREIGAESVVPQPSFRRDGTANRQEGAPSHRCPPSVQARRYYFDSAGIQTFVTRFPGMINDRNLRPQKARVRMRSSKVFHLSEIIVFNDVILEDQADIFSLDIVQCLVDCCI